MEPCTPSNPPNALLFLFDAIFCHFGLCQTFAPLHPRIKEQKCYNWGGHGYTYRLPPSQQALNHARSSSTSKLRTGLFFRPPISRQYHPPLLQHLITGEPTDLPYKKKHRPLHIQSAPNRQNQTKHRLSLNQAQLVSNKHPEPAFV